MTNINDYFNFFEEKYNIRLTDQQKKIFIESVVENKLVIHTGLRSGKTILNYLFKEYSQWRGKVMEDYIPCENIDCSLNKAYKKENVEKEDCYCTRFTFRDLQNRTFCEERKW